MSRMDIAARVCVWAIAVCLIGVAASEALGQPPLSSEAIDPAPGTLEAFPETATQDLPPVAPPQGPPEQGLFAMLLGRGPQAGPSPRLAGVPNMFGDFFGLGGNITANDISTGQGSSPIPLAGASRRMKVAENNKALPMDRVHFMYNHFQNALEFNAQGFPGSSGQKSFSVDRFTLGIEKTFLNGKYSVEVRMPLASQADFQQTSFGVSGGEVGNLAVLVKRTLWKTCTTSAVIGLGVDLPTGDDVEGFVNLLDYRVDNESVHLMPYVGVTYNPNACVFYHGFFQVDVPTGGNSVDLVDNVVTGGIPVHLGRLNEQTAMYIDLGAGYWLYRNPCAPCFSGLAAVVEFHYATTLTDADSLGYIGQAGLTTLNFGNTANRIDQTNVTVGLHAQLARCTVARVGAVFPISDGYDRSFDSELQAQVERRF